MKQGCSMLIILLYLADMSTLPRMVLVLVKYDERCWLDLLGWYAYVVSRSYNDTHGDGTCHMSVTLV